MGERKVTVGIRPEHIAFAAAPGSDTVSSKVDVSEMMGSEVYLHVNAVGRDVVLRIPTTDLPAEQLDEILDPIRLARGLGQTCRERQE